jgi:hypothetical protein
MGDRLLNRLISAARVVVEQSSAGVQRWRMVKEV